jgi:hypothetical protein
MREFTLLPWQGRALGVPLQFDIALLGGRAGGKSFCVAALLLQYLTLYADARVLVLRQSFPGLQDMTSLLLLLFPLADPAARWNGSAHTWTFSNGSTVELGILDDERSFARYQGRNFHVIATDEAGQFGDPRLLDLMRSCLRAGDGRPVRFILAANPGGPGHHWLHKRYVVPATPWVPFVEPVSRRECVTIPTTLADNDRLDQVDYRRQLEAAAAGDRELLRAWLDGDWASARGAFFSDVLDEHRNLVPNWDRRPDVEPALQDLGAAARHEAQRCGTWTPRRPGLAPRWPAWEFFLAHDWGSRAPSVTYWCARSPGAYHDGRFYPRDSIVIFDEHATVATWDDLNRGTAETVPEVAARIRAICAHWGVPATGVADDACFARQGHAAGSVADEFRAAGVTFTAAQKADRFSGWGLMRTLLRQAGELDVPGLYVARRARYFWSTVPFLARDPRRPEDVESRGPDHGADAVRYALCRDREVVGIAKLPRNH